MLMHACSIDHWNAAHGSIYHSVQILIEKTFKTKLPDQLQLQINETLQNVPAMT